jgi:hypothetical protein
MNGVRLRDPFNDVLLVDAMRASAAERSAAVSRLEALFRVRTLPAHSLDRRALADLYCLAFEHTVARSYGHPAETVLRRRIEEAVEAGRLLVIVCPRRQVVVPLPVEEAEPLLGPADEPTSWIEIELVDDSGNPVADEPYVLVTGDDRTRSGVLDRDGRAREDGIDPGNCKVTFPRLHEWRAA